MIFNEYADQASSVKIEFASGESREAKLVRHDEHGVIVSDRTGVYYVPWTSVVELQYKGVTV